MDLTRQGKPDELQRVLQEAGAAGLLNAAEARSRAEQLLPEARYNAAQQKLLQIGDYETALQAIRGPDFANRAGLDGEQAKKLESDFDGRKKSAELAAQQQLGKAQEATFAEFMKLAVDETNFDKLGQDGIGKYLEGVAPEDREAVQRFSESLAATEPAKAAQGRVQAVLYSRMGQQMKDWNGSGDAPWSLDTLTNLMAKGLLTESQRDKLEGDWQEVQKEISAGERTPQRMQQMRNTSDLRGRMYTGKDELKDPAVVLSMRDIEDAFVKGDISIEQRDKLKSERERLHSDYLVDMEREKKAKGPLREDPQAEAALWAIVTDDRLSPEAKAMQAKKYLFNGVPGDKWLQITKNIDELNNHSATWKPRMDALRQFYSASINALGKGDDERKRLALELAATSQALMQLFRAYPDDPAKWDAGLQSLLEPLSKREIMKRVEDQLQAKFPGLFGLGMSQAMALETMSEQMPAEFVSQPLLGAQRTLTFEERRTEEEKTLTRAGVQVVDRAQDENGTWIFSSQPIPRDPKTGKPLFDEPRKAGVLYQVRSRKQGDRIIQIPGRMK